MIHIRHLPHGFFTGNKALPHIKRSCVAKLWLFIFYIKALDKLI